MCLSIRLLRMMLLSAQIRYLFRRQRRFLIQACLVIFLLICIFHEYKLVGDTGKKNLQKAKIHSNRLDEESVGGPRRKERFRSFLPTHFYSQEMLKEVQGYKTFGEFDPRLLPSLYINFISRELSSNGELSEDFALPFNWNMLSDNIRKIQQNSLYNEIIKKRVNCSVLRDTISYRGKKFGCQPVSISDETSAYGLNIDIARNTMIYFEQLDMRLLYANLHGLTSFQNPEKIIFLGALDNTQSLMVPTRKFSDGNQDLPNGQINHLSLGLNVLVQEFIEEASKPNKDLKKLLIDGISGYNELLELNELTKENLILDEFILNEKINEDPTEPLVLDHTLFDWNLSQEIDSLSDDDVLKTYLSQAADPNFEELKHFGEALLLEKKGESGHFDWRFFNGFTRDNSELHQATIHRMFRSWFKFSNDAGIYSWMSHGSLIGYYWNGYTLPNDNDIDIQVPIQSLKKLARILNNTIMFDMTYDGYVNEEFGIDSAAGIGFRSYYLDINPLFGARTNLKSHNNVIDARFIDVYTGIYIDITALASFNSHTNKESQVVKDTLANFDVADVTRFIEPLMYDLFYDGITPKNKVSGRNRRKFKENREAKSIELYQKLYYDVFFELDMGNFPKIFDNLVNCRNHHFYNLNEFLPLIPTYFENIITYIPSNWFKLLIVEYDSKVIELLNFKGYSFVSSMNMWISPNECKFKGHDMEKVKEDCLSSNNYLKKEYNRLEPYIHKHKQLLQKTLPFNNLQAEVINIKDTFADKHYNKSNFEALFEKFDNSLLRSEPWVAHNLF